MRLYVISVRMRANTPFTKFSEVFHAWIRCVCKRETAIKTFQVNFNHLKIFLHCDPQHKPETKAHCSPLAALKNVPLPSASSIELASSLSSLPAARSTAAAAECVWLHKLPPFRPDIFLSPFCALASRAAAYWEPKDCVQMSESDGKVLSVCTTRGTQLHRHTHKTPQSHNKTIFACSLLQVSLALACSAQPACL